MKSAHHGHESSADGLIRCGGMIPCEGVAKASILLLSTGFCQQRSYFFLTPVKSGILLIPFHFPPVPPPTYYHTRRFNFSAIHRTSRTISSSALFLTNQNTSIMTDSNKYSNKLAGARVLIIGGSSGIGYCVAEACLEFGASVVISSSQQSRIDSSINQLFQTYPSARAQGRLAGYACDLSSSTVEANLEHLLKQCGSPKFDHIVHTAGDSLATSKLEDTTLESLQKAAMVRFNSPLLLAKHAPNYLNPGPASSITLTTGVISRKPSKDWTMVAGYATGLHGMVRNLALDLAPIRVNLISPGAVLTPLWDGWEEEEKKKVMARFGAASTTGKVGRAEDVAESYLYVMRDWNVAGSVIDTNGGCLLI